MTNPGQKERGLAYVRYEWRAQVMSRLNRLKNLLTTKWWIPTLSIALGLGCQAWQWQGEKPLYSSTGRMIVSIKLSIPEGSVYTEELNNFLGTQAALMQSGVVRNRACARMASAHPDWPVESIQLKVDILPKTTIFLLRGSGAEPRSTEAFVQACMEEYVNLKKEMRSRTSDNTIEGLHEDVMRLKAELSRGEEEMVEFQRTNSVVMLQDQGNTAGHYLTGLNERLASLKSEYELLEALTLEQNLDRQQKAAAISSGSPQSPDPSSPVGGERTDSDYLRARQNILLLKAERDDLGQYLRPKHPKIVALTEEIARREKLIGIFRQQSVDQSASRKSSLKLQIDNLEREVGEWNVKTLEIGRKTAEYQRLKSESQRTQALYDHLLATMQTLGINKDISPESVNIMEKASPAYPERPDLRSKLVFGAMAGLASSLLLMVVLDRLDDRVNSRSELMDLFEEDILGQIPREKGSEPRGEIPLLRPGDDRHSFLEAYRNLRSALLYSSERGKRPKTLLVTSSVPNDGKSLTSANLAITLANAGARVLLVDGDLRKGSLHTRFGLVAGPGLSEVFSEDRKWTELLWDSGFPRLTILPRGAATQHASELFVLKPIDGLLNEAGARFDFVIFDSAPVMAADDVTGLAPYFDGVLFVLRAEHTSARVAHSALESLYQRQARVLGLVFNSIRPSTLDYYYYYKYKNYYKAPSENPAVSVEKGVPAGQSRPPQPRSDMKGQKTGFVAVDAEFRVKRGSPAKPAKSGLDKPSSHPDAGGSQTGA